MLDKNGLPMPPHQFPPSAFSAFSAAAAAAAGADHARAVWDARLAAAHPAAGMHAAAVAAAAAAAAQQQQTVAAAAAAAAVGTTANPSVASVSSATGPQQRK